MNRKSNKKVEYIELFKAKQEFRKSMEIKWKYTNSRK